MRRRCKLHPEAKIAQVAERVKERASKDPLPRTWKWPNGYRLRLFGLDWSIRHRVVSTYEEAVRTREEEWKTGRYDSISIEESRTPQRRFRKRTMRKDDEDL